MQFAIFCRYRHLSGKKSSDSGMKKNWTYIFISEIKQYYCRNYLIKGGPRKVQIQTVGFHYSAVNFLVPKFDFKVKLVRFLAIVRFLALTLV